MVGPKSMVFGQESTYHLGKIFKKFLRAMTVCSKIFNFIDNDEVEIGVFIVSFQLYKVM